MVGLSSVIYELDVLYLDGLEYEVCVSEDFMNNEYSYSTLAKICNKSGEILGKQKYEYVISCVPHLKKWIDSILTFDCAINNHDRHLDNFTVKLNKDSIEPCLCYDFGDSLFSTFKTIELKKVLDMPLNYTQSKPFGSIHSAQIKYIGDTFLLPVRIVDVYKLVNSYLDAERAKWINKWLILRLKELNLTKN